MAVAVMRIYCSEVAGLISPHLSRTLHFKGLQIDNLLFVGSYRHSTAPRKTFSQMAKQLPDARDEHAQRSLRQELEGVRLAYLIYKVNAYRQDSRGRGCRLPMRARFLFTPPSRAKGPATPCS